MSLNLPKSKLLIGYNILKKIILYSLDNIDNLKCNFIGKTEVWERLSCQRADYCKQTVGAPASVHPII